MLGGLVAENLVSGSRCARFLRVYACRRTCDARGGDESKGDKGRQTKRKKRGEGERNARTDTRSTDRMTGRARIPKREDS